MLSVVVEFMFEIRTYIQKIYSFWIGFPCDRAKHNLQLRTKVLNSSLKIDLWHCAKQVLRVCRSRLRSLSLYHISDMHIYTFVSRFIYNRRFHFCIHSLFTYHKNDDKNSDRKSEYIEQSYTPKNGNEIGFPLL